MGKRSLPRTTIIDTGLTSKLLPTTARLALEVTKRHHNRCKQTNHDFFSGFLICLKNRMDREINVDSIRALEERIKEHERSTIKLKLKRARNSLLNVSTLPLEVLGNISRWNIVVEEHFGGLEKGSHNFLLVCHHWFEVASRTPELWGFWGNNLGDWEKRCLRSSTGTPLDLVLDGLICTFGSTSESQRTVIENRAARDNIRRVHLRSDTHHLTSIITPLLSPLGGLQTCGAQNAYHWMSPSSTTPVSRNYDTSNSATARSRRGTTSRHEPCF